MEGQSGVVVYAVSIIIALVVVAMLLIYVLPKILG